MDEIHGIQDNPMSVEKALLELYEGWGGPQLSGEFRDGLYHQFRTGKDHDGCPFLIFSFSDGKDFDQEIRKPFVQYIRKHRLGTIYQTQAKFNPNSKNNVVAHIWQVNAKAFHRWAKKQPEYKTRFPHPLKKS